MVGKIKRTYPKQLPIMDPDGTRRMVDFNTAPDFAVESEAPIGEYMKRERGLRELLRRMDADDASVREEFEQHRRIKARIDMHLDGSIWDEFEALRTWKAKQVIIEIHYNVLYSLAHGGMLGESCQ